MILDLPVPVGPQNMGWVAGDTMSMVMSLFMLMESMVVE